MTWSAGDLGGWGPEMLCRDQFIHCLALTLPLRFRFSAPSCCNRSLS